LYEALQNFFHEWIFLLAQGILRKSISLCGYTKEVTQPALSSFFGVGWHIIHILTFRLFNLRKRVDVMNKDSNSDGPLI
jgi:hypothetical protein